MNLVKCDDDPQFIRLSKVTGILLVKKFSTKFLWFQILSSIELKRPWPFQGGGFSPPPIAPQ